MAMSHTRHFHPAAISTHYRLEEVDKFADDCESAGAAGMKREIHAAILIDSHLSNAKYTFVARSIWFLAASVIFGFFYLVAIQF